LLIFASSLIAGPDIGVQRQTASGAERRLLDVRCNDGLGVIAP